MAGDLMRALWRLFVAVASILAVIAGVWAGIHDRYAEGAFYLLIALLNDVADARWIVKEGRR